MILNPFMVLASGGGGGGGGDEWESAPIAYVDTTAAATELTPRLNDPSRPFLSPDDAYAALSSEYFSSGLDLVMTFSSHCTSTLTLDSAQWARVLTLNGYPINRIDAYINSPGGLTVNNSVGLLATHLQGDNLDWGVISGNGEVDQIDLLEYTGGGGFGGNGSNGSDVTAGDGAAGGVGDAGGPGNFADASGQNGGSGGYGWSAGQVSFTGNIGLGVIIGHGQAGANGGTGGDAAIAIGGNGGAGGAGDAGVNDYLAPDLVFDGSVAYGTSFVCYYQVNGSNLGSAITFSSGDPANGSLWVNTDQPYPDIASSFAAAMSTIASGTSISVSWGSGTYIVTIHNPDLLGASTSHGILTDFGTAYGFSGGGSGSSEPFETDGGAGGDGGNAWANGGNGGSGGNGGNGLNIYLNGVARGQTLYADGGAYGYGGGGGAGGTATAGGGGMGGPAGGASSNPGANGGAGSKSELAGSNGTDGTAGTGGTVYS